MTQNINNTDHKQFWIAHGPDVVMFGEADIGVRTVTGQPNLEIFDDEESWADRVRELGSEPYPPEEEEDDYYWDEDAANWSPSEEIGE